MVTAGAIVAAAALPVGLVAWMLARRRAQPLLLPWKPWRVPWGGFELIFAFVTLAFVVPLTLNQLGVLLLAIPVIALPFDLALLVIAWRSLYPKWRPFARGGMAGRLALAVIAWVVLTP